MSDLSGGRAGNGGLRAGGPVPVQPSGTPQGIRTPRDIMRDRNTREQRRQEEQKAEEARRLAEERRRSAERRAATVSGVPRASQASSVYPPDVSVQQGGFDGAGDRRSAAGRVSGADVLGEPTGRIQQDAPGPSRTRASSGGQAQAQPASSSSRGPRLAQATPRQPPPQSSAGAQSTSSTAGGGGGGGGAQSFPHAFERWETLSSHWEGLTSYWLHKLEANTEEIRNTIPNASTLNRQINDLSAAGANLFHAVVELQRLRASSERKFQRWFFETRADTERQQEVQAQVERQLRLERSAREEAVGKRAEAEEAATLARREVAEMRRELMISKEEARRAWEELGRRNQEALDTAENLKRGMGAVVGGVNVIPYFGTASRAGSASQRPNTRDGQQQQYGGLPPAPSAGAAGLASPGDEAYYRQGPQGQTSPTNTDPFTEQQQPPLHHEPDKPSLAAGTYRPYPQGSTSQAEPASSRTVAPTTSAAATDQAQAFYQHGPAETFLHGSSSGAPSVPGQRREDLRSEPSYVESEGETEYAIDAAGNIRHDEQGRPIVFQTRPSGTTQQRPTVRPVETQEDDDDPYDSDAVRREREHAERYGRMPAAPEAPGGGGSRTGGGGQPDYEGEGYGGWENLQSAQQTRHHHPTRLSDVLEEEEERSSRHTGH